GPPTASHGSELRGGPGGSSRWSGGLPDQRCGYRTSPITRAGLPATTAKAGTSRVTTAPAPTSARGEIVTPARIVALLPIAAPRHTNVRISRQSFSLLRWPSSVVARGKRSLVNI